MVPPTAVLRRENPNNRYIKPSEVRAVLKRYGVDVPVNNIELFRRAFVHRSYLKLDHQPDLPEIKVAVPLQDNCNERLELLGDCILGSVVGTYLFTRYKEQPEGFLTKTKTKIVRGKTLGRLSRRMGFGKWVVVSLHVENEGGRNNIRILEDLFECFIGALYLDNGGQPFEVEQFNLDQAAYRAAKQALESFEKALDPAQVLDPSQVQRYLELSQKYQQRASQIIASNAAGYQICQRFIMNVLEQEIDLVKLIRLDDNYKDQIQRHFLDQIGVFPEWELLKTEGPTNNRCYTVGIRDDRGALVGIGKGRKKIRAEQMASKQALKHYGVEVYSDSEDEEESYMKNKA